MTTLHTDITALANKGPRGVCEEFDKLTVAEFTDTHRSVLSIVTDNSTPTPKDASPRDCLSPDVGTAPSPGAVAAFKAAATDLIGDARSSTQSTPQPVKASASTVSSEDLQLVPDTFFAVKAISPDIITTGPVADSKFIPDDKSASGTRFTLPSNQLSAASTSNKTSESILPTKDGSKTVKRSDSRRKTGVKRDFKSFTRSLTSLVVVTRLYLHHGR